MTWKYCVRMMTVLSLVTTSGPSPLYAAGSASIESQPALMSLKIRDVRPVTPICEEKVVADKFEPLQGALDRARQSVADTVKQGQEMVKTDLGVEGAKHLHAAIVEVQNRMGDLEKMADDRAIKREIGKLSLTEQLQITLQTGERAEIYAQHFAAAEMLMIRRLIGGLAEVAETATGTLELNETLAKLANSASTAPKGKLEILKKELADLQNRRGEFLNATRKATELEFEFSGAINRLDEAYQSGQTFVRGLTPEQLAQPAIRILIQSLTNLTQMVSGARLFKQTIQEFDSNIIEARGRFDQNVNKTDLALQARITEMSLAEQRLALQKAAEIEAAKTKLAERERERLDAAKTRIAERDSRIVESAQARSAAKGIPQPVSRDSSFGAIIAATSAIAAVGALIGFLVLSQSGSPSYPSKPSYEKSYEVPYSPPSYDGGAYRGSGRGGCFVAGTQVLTSEGSIAIEKIRRGDIVLSFNHTTGKTEAARVAKVSVFAKRLYGLASFADGQSIDVTANHEFFSTDRQAYVPIADLYAGENVRLFKDGKVTAVKFKSYTPLAAYRDVYNFEVEGNHNYFIGSGILVHNKIL